VNAPRWSGSEGLLPGRLPQTIEVADIASATGRDRVHPVGSTTRVEDGYRPSGQERVRRSPSKSRRGPGQHRCAGSITIRVPRLRIFDCPPFRRTWQPRRLLSVGAQACFDTVGTASNNVAQIVRVAPSVRVNAFRRSGNERWRQVTRSGFSLFGRGGGASMERVSDLKVPVQRLPPPSFHDGNRRSSRLRPRSLVRAATRRAALLSDAECATRRVLPVRLDDHAFAAGDSCRDRLLHTATRCGARSTRPPSWSLP
jgi:hypothetical protein